VTRVSVRTARRGAGRVARALLGGLLAAMLAGCSSNGTGDTASTAALTTPPPAQTPTKPVTFAPVIGAPAKISTRINELLVAQAGQKSVPVVPPKDAEYTIRGYLVASSDPKGAKLSYIWDVSDKSNKRKRIQGEELIEGKKGGDPWTAVDDAAMQRVATKAIDDIVAFLPKGAPVPAGAGAPVAAGDSEKPKEASAPAVVSTSNSSSSFNPLAALFGSSSSSETASSTPTSLSSEPPSPPASSGPVKVASLGDDTPTSLAKASAPSSAPVQRASANSGPVLAAQTSQPDRAERTPRPDPVVERAPKPEPVERASQPERPVQPEPVKVAAVQPTADAVAVVPAVSGAPGDGGQSLTAAMRKHLLSAGVKLSDRSSSGANVYTVRGTVEMGGAVDGQQPITIQWTVVDPSGKPLSQAVVQRNKVSQGSLDGPWGQIADMAAGEAAKSIAKLIKPAG
jgi:hypothetical protein